MRARHWFHCTDRFHGKKWTAARRGPVIKDDKEPDTPRLCVCPNVAACFAARLHNHRKPVYVYRTAKERRTNAPKDVWDAIITRERWLVPPVEMIHVDTIPLSISEEIQYISVAYHKYTKKPGSWKLRLAEYFHALKTLAAMPPEMRKPGVVYYTERELKALTKLAERFGIGNDPAHYVLELCFPSTPTEPDNEASVCDRQQPDTV